MIPAEIMALEQYADSLLPHHRAALRARGLSQETILAAGIRSITSPEEAAAILGLKKPFKGIVPAIKIPFTDDLGQNGYSRLRPDTPRKIKEKPVKYESPRNKPNQIYRPPGVVQYIQDGGPEILITEGEFKALVATQAGFPCIGLVGVFGHKPKGHEKLSAELERVPWQGRDVAIAFDSDIDRNPAVQLAESRLAKNLMDRGAKVRCVRLPDGPPDENGQPTKMGLDDFIVARGAVELRKLIDAAVEPEPLQGAEAKEGADKIEPATFAKEHLAGRCTDGLPHLRYHRGTPYLWSGGRYREVEQNDVDAELIRSINRNYIYLTTGQLGNVRAQVKAQSAIASFIEPPAWLDLPPVDWSPESVLATPRQLIHIPSLVAGKEPYAIPRTPRFFTHNALDYEFNLDAPPPRLFFEFTEQLWGADAESIQTLQEIFGYLLTNDTSLQKIFMLLGPPRAGKGVLTRLTERLVGKANCASPTLASLETNFGLQPLLNKTVALIADARLSARVDQSKVVERLLSISGEDSLTVDRKFREQVTCKIPARLLIVSNELPRLAESSGALSSRMIVLKLTKTFLGREDTSLTDKLLAELPGILLWSIAGWQRLHERGYFVQPEAGKELAGEMRDLSSPVGMFVRDCCKVGPQFCAAVDDVYAAWVQWCKDNGRDHPGTKQTFGRDLRAAVPELRDSQPRDDGQRFRRYEGVGLAN